ncbi:MAG TPA: tRNA (adenosine(37)-N6)-threonylcarbamoyltransferase complex transferase subunit TsaD [Candidatus Acidoferrum sp.]|nr:tRNA (adenosine(37)-N6)-threonylcarbamoyltransferase complex transferase subunit TsaD [Candidatus Acidoferrum sp.]
MKILGIETSCDETAAAVVVDGRKILSNVIRSQVDIHQAFGGVVPEVAARSHIEVVLPVIEQALQDSKCGWDDIDALAVSNGPGLLGSLLIGVLAARTLAVTKNKPLYPINHVKAHVYANFLQDTQPEFPILALIVSGNHSQLVVFHSHDNYQMLGQTQDDAAGEAFDKVARLIGLVRPSGALIPAAAEQGDPYKFHFPKAHMQGAYDFSFSGLKTAVLRQAQVLCGKTHNFPSSGLAGLLTASQQADIAASFQRVAVETLVDKTVKAFTEFQPKTVVIGGGVAANQELRRQLQERLPIPVNYPPIELCTDNAVMIASLAFFQSAYEPACDPYTLGVNPSLSM